MAWKKLFPHRFLLEKLACLLTVVGKLPSFWYNSVMSSIIEELAQIVVAEDDSTIRTILGMALSGAGFRHVRECARGDVALSEIRSRPPDLVLLDVMLPGLDGFSICRSLREDRARRHSARPRGRNRRDTPEF